MKYDTSLKSQAYDKIRAHLIFGELPAGSEISEPRLSQMLGIGRTPVREAVQQLEAEGLLERSPRRGTVVRVPKRKDIVDLFEVREGMEGLAVYLAADRITPADISHLQKLCDQLGIIATQLEESGEEVLDGPLLRQFVAADMGFHMLLISATGNQRLVKLISDAQVLSRIFNTIGSVGREQTLDVLRNTQSMHLDIFKAIRRGDGEKARDVMMSHIRRSREETLANFDAQQDNSGTSTGLEHLHVPFEVLMEFERLGLSQDDEADSSSGFQKRGAKKKAASRPKTPARRKRKPPQA